MVARQAHNLEVVRSSRASATKKPHPNRMGLFFLPLPLLQKYIYEQRPTVVSLRRFFIFHFAMYVSILRVLLRTKSKSACQFLKTGARFYFASTKLQIKTKIAIKI